MAKKAKKRVPQFISWTVKFSVHKSWVEDGFDLDDDRALDMLSSDLGYAHIDTELKAKVLKKPDARIVAELQGYKEPA